MSPTIIQDSLLDPVQPPGAVDEDGQYLATAQFDRLYERYLTPLYRYLLSKTGDIAEAEDLSSQTFLAALEKLPSYRHSGYFSAWLFGIARHKCMDHYRLRKHTLPMLEELAPHVEIDALQSVIQKEKREAVRTLVNRLPEDERELLRLRLVAGLKFGEMAELLNFQEDTVKKAYYRLIERMKKELEANDD